MNINSPLCRHYFALLSVNIKANLCLKASNVLTISEGGVLVVIVAPQWHKMQKKNKAECHCSFGGRPSQHKNECAAFTL